MTVKIETPTKNSSEQARQSASALFAERAGNLISLAYDLGALMRGNFTLGSGLKSDFYFDGRALAMSRQGLPLVVELLSTVIKDFERDDQLTGIGGPIVGSVPIVGALAYALGRDAFFVRPQPKVHGARKLVEGPDLKGKRVAVVEDTVTTGGSLLRTLDSLQEYGCQVELVLALLDRGNQLAAELHTRKIPYFAVLYATATGELHPASVPAW